MNWSKTCLTWLRNSTIRTLLITFLQIVCKTFDSFRVIVKSFITALVIVKTFRNADEDSGGSPEHELVKDMSDLATE